MICDSLGAEQIDALLRKWLAILPTPFTDEDQAAGYRYECSILQAEFSLTQMLDAPGVGAHLLRTSTSATTSTSAAPTTSALIFHRRILARPRTQDPGPVPYPGDHRRCRPVTACRLQEHQNQAVLQLRREVARDERLCRLEDQPMLKT